jgi:hypothetical protein
MNRQQGTIRRTLLAMAIAAFGASGSALADTEVEPNNNFAQPQKLEVGARGIVTVFGAIKNASTSSPDVDYYSFEGQEGAVITVDIDGTTTDLDTVLHLFDPTGIMKMQSLDTEPLDAGSNPYEPGANATFDASLQFMLDSSGTWKIAVTADPAYLTHQGNFTMSKAFSNGSYTLIVSGLQPSMQHISIDIKPGNDERARINPNAKGSIPVAILGSSDFDPSEIDETSLKFGPTGNEASFRRCNKEREDVRGRGPRDRVCHFDMEKAQFRPGHTVGVLKGTKGGKPFEGRGDLKVMPEKRKD